MSDLPAPRFHFRDTFLLAGLRRLHDPRQASDTIARQWQDFAALGELPAMDGRQYGVLCGSGEGGFEYMTAIEVPNFNVVSGELGRMRVPAQRYAIFDSNGRSLRELWTAIFAWLDGGPFSSAHRPDFEVYPGPAGGPSAGAPELWVGVVPAGMGDY